MVQYRYVIGPKITVPLHSTVGYSSIAIIEWIMVVVLSLVTLVVLYRTLMFLIKHLN